LKSSAGMESGTRARIFLPVPKPDSPSFLSLAITSHPDLPWPELFMKLKRSGGSLFQVSFLCGLTETRRKEILLNSGSEPSTIEFSSIQEETGICLFRWRQSFLRCGSAAPKGSQNHIGVVKALSSYIEVKRDQG